MFILFSINFSSCTKDSIRKNRIVIWTNCGEFAQYIEVFNNTHPDDKAILVYKENPALSLPPAKDELPPDIIVGSWLRTDSTAKNFKNLDYLFDRKTLSSSIFYPSLLDSGKINRHQYLLPVSFNLPAIIFSEQNKDMITDNYILNLNQIRSIASSYNGKNKKDLFTKIGFITLTNSDFLYFAAKSGNSSFREEKGQIVWNDENLNKSIENLREWVRNENNSPSVEQDFAFKYLSMPDYRQVTSGRTLFSYTTSDNLFETMKKHDLNLDYRWLCGDDSLIPMEDSYVMMGIYKNVVNQVGASEFINWFYQVENQKQIIERKIAFNLNTELFGIAGGFSSLKEVTEHVLPVYYTQMLSNLPPASMFKIPEKLPARWESYKAMVVEPFIRESVIAETEEDKPSFADLESDWHNKVFD